MSNKGLYVSYSAASRFKTCPTKYYLSKKYQSKLIPSALPLGKAIEAGVETLLLGGSLPEALTVFTMNWSSEDVKNSERRPIYDNLAVEFYASDFDKSLIVEEKAEQVQKWADELLKSDLAWQETFDNISTQMKKDESRVSTAELTFYNRVMWFSCLTRGQIMIKAFYDKLLPKLTLLKDDAGNPIKQREVSIENEDGDKIVGYIDFVVKHVDYQEPIILDLKTAAYEYPEHALTTSEQLRTYVAAIGADLGTRRAGYAVLIKKIVVEKSCDKCGAKREGLAKNCKACGKGQYTKTTFDGEVQFVTKKYEDSELEDVLSDYSSVITAIKTDVNFKVPGNCNQFNRKCEFYDVCWKRKQASEIEHLEEKKSLTETVEVGKTNE